MTRDGNTPPTTGGTGARRDEREAQRDFARGVEFARTRQFALKAALRYCESRLAPPDQASGQDVVQVAQAFADFLSGEAAS